MRIGVFGGTFDPIHIGHLAAAEEARLAAGLDLVLFVPAARPPHKPHSVSAPAAARLEMVRLAIAGNPCFTASALELERPGPSYTVDTLRALAHARPGDDLFYVLGADSLPELGTWREPEALCRLAEFLVVARPGWPEGALQAWLQRQPVTLRPRVRLIAAPGMDVSSREIRRRLANGEPGRYLLPEPVRRYIQARGLYR
jgi:nicotinate-nucleotide adenylyltransferase